MKNYKNYYADVKLSLAINFYAENKKDFIEKLREQFKQDHNIELQDKEIHNIQGGI